MDILQKEQYYLIQLMIYVKTVPVSVIKVI